MKKRVISLLLVSAMAASMLTACGAKTEAETYEDGKVLNIYCWNEEFQSRVADHYPGYEKIDATHGKIGDVTVLWNITPSDNNAYQENLDATLDKQEKAKNNNKIDIFLVEADYALKYVDDDCTMSMADLGITDADTKDMYQYTKDVVTDANGNLKGLSWQAAPGVLFYNREFAKEILGTDDPEAVQEFVKDWDTFTQTAQTVADAGYHMTSSVMDTYRVYSNNVTKKWVDDNDTIQIDENIMKWVEDSKKLYDMGATGTHDLWSDDWNKGFFPEGKVFCYFGPAWLVNFCMAADKEGSVGNLGQWGACTGPQGFYWGGTWICAANGTDNADLVKDIITTLTCNPSVLKDIVVKDDDFANNSVVMDEMAADTSYSSAILGGQNPLGMYAAGVKSIDLSNISKYDSGCNIDFQSKINDYFKDNCSLEESLDAFYEAAKIRYPELVKPE